MTKRKTAKANVTSKAPKTMYVILQPILYKSMIPEEFELINPADDPYADDAPRREFEHLGEADINRLVMRRLIAEYVPQAAKEIKGE